MFIKLLSSSILTMDLAEDVGNAVMSMFYKIMLTLDAIVFYTLDVCYQVFLALSRARIFEEDFFGGFIRRFYVLIGVLMMFFIVYTLLKVIVNPDEMSKGNMAPGKIVTNTLTSIVLVALLPTIFNVLYRVQGVLLDNDIIGRIVIGGRSADSIQDSVKKGGREMAVQVFTAFFYPNDGFTEETVIGASGHEISFAEAKRQFIEEEVSFWVFCDFSYNAAEGQIHYSWLMSTIAGGFCLYVMLCFVFDVGIRAVKLGVLQIIAPIPVLMRVLPNKDKTFSSWVTMTLSTFFEVFIRIFLIYMIAVLAGQLGTIFESMGDSFSGLSFAVKKLAQAFLLMGIIAFAKQAPKMLSDLLGIKSGNMGLSLKQRMIAGGGFVLGGATYAGLTTGTRNAIERGKEARNKWGEMNKTMKNENATTKEKAKAAGSFAGSIGKIATSTVAGAGSAFVRGGYASLNAKSFGEMKKSANKASDAAVNVRNKRDEHPMFDYKKDKEGNILKDKGKVFTGGLLGSRLRDAGRSISAWATGRTAESLQKSEKFYGDLTSKEDTITQSIEAKMDKDLKNVIVRDAKNGGKIMLDKDGNVLTLGKLQSDYENLHNQFIRLDRKDFESDDLFEAAKNKLRVDRDAAEKVFKDAKRDAIATQFDAERHNDIDKAVIFKSVVDDLQVELIRDAAGNIQKDDKGNVIGNVRIIKPDEVIRVDGVTSLIKEYESAVSDHRVAISNDVKDELRALDKEFNKEFVRAGGARDMVIKEMNEKAESLNRILTHINDMTATEFTFTEYVTRDDDGNLITDINKARRISEEKIINSKKLADSWKTQKNIVSEAILDLTIKSENNDKKDK